MTTITIGGRNRFFSKLYRCTQDFLFKAQFKCELYRLTRSQILNVESTGKNFARGLSRGTMRAHFIHLMV